MCVVFRKNFKWNNLVYLHVKYFCRKNNNEVKSITSAYSFMDLIWCLLSGVNFCKSFWLLSFFDVWMIKYLLWSQSLFLLRCFHNVFRILLTWFYYEQKCFLVSHKTCSHFGKICILPNSAIFTTFYITFDNKCESFSSLLLQIKHPT